VVVLIWIVFFCLFERLEDVSVVLSLFSNWVSRLSVFVLLVDVMLSSIVIVFGVGAIAIVKQFCKACLHKAPVGFVPTGYVYRDFCRV
jgi:hypothetical protein